MSPSEDKGLALGLRLLRIEPHKATTATPAGLVRTKVFAEFESPPIQAGTRSTILRTGRGAPAERRHVLKTFAKSRAGAWRIAVRWLRKLQAGELK